MKRLLFIFSFLSALTINAQTDSLTVHVEGKTLANLLTDEQKQSVNHLFITGTLTEEDYAFLRGNNLPKLHELNLRKADIDTIPKKAFYGWDFNYGLAGLKTGRIILPESLTCISDSAFYESWTIIELTGKFPAIGSAAFAYSPNTKPNLEVSDQNPYCKDSAGYILSSDGTILWYCRNMDHPLYKEIPTGVEIIEEKAFEYSSFCQITIPETVKRIKDHAFNNCFPNGTHNSGSEVFIMKSTTPPFLGCNVFSGYIFEHNPVLVVPDGSVELYRNADVQWNIFSNIQEKMPVSHICIAKKNNIIVSRNAGWFNITSHIPLKRISVYNLQGKCLYNIYFTHNKTTHAIQFISGQKVIEIIVSNGEKRIIKF